MFTLRQLSTRDDVFPTRRYDPALTLPMTLLLILPDGDAAEGGEGGASQPAEGSDKAQAAATAAEPAEEVNEGNLKEMLGKLDLQLHWLWKVHGIDYYAGVELNEQDWQYRLNCCRLIRGPQPEEGAAGEAGPDGSDKEKGDAEKLGKTVDECWQRRIEAGDPIEAKCMKARVRGSRSSS